MRRRRWACSTIIAIIGTGILPDYNSRARHRLGRFGRRHQSLHLGFRKVLAGPQVAVTSSWSRQPP
jgi:hypothetical protein